MKFTPHALLSSAANPVVKDTRALSQKKNRDETGLFLVEGQQRVEEALAAGWQITTLFTAQSFFLSEALKLALKDFSGHWFEATSDIIGRITGRDNPEDVLGIFRQQHAAPEAFAQGVWVALEDVRDPGNLGTIMRTAAAAGAEGVALIGSCCDPFAPEAIRASVGAFARIKVLAMDAPAFVEFAAKYKGRIIGTHLSATDDYRKANYSAPLLLLMGSEHAGLTPEVAKAATQLVLIPMSGKVESLNLATATALMLYEAKRGVL